MLSCVLRVVALSFLFLVVKPIHCKPINVGIASKKDAVIENQTFDKTGNATEDKIISNILKEIQSLRHRSIGMKVNL